MITPDQKREIDELMTDVAASFIDIKPNIVPTETPKVSPNHAAKQIWSAKSNKLLTDYQYGENLALYGDSEVSTLKFFKRLSTAINAIITNELQKNGQTSESFKQYYNILDNIMIIMAKEIDKKGLKDYDVNSMIASLQGFILNYGTRKVNK